MTMLAASLPSVHVRELEVGLDHELMRILVVDDNPAIHDDFKKILSPAAGAGPKLERLELELFGELGTQASLKPPDPGTSRGFSISSALQGERAIELLAEGLAEGHPFNLAFVDVRMPPGMSGIDTIARLWQLDPRLQVVVCSAYSDHTWSDIVRRLGHSDGLLVLRKPFESIEVLQLAHALTRKWSLDQALKQRLNDLELAVRARTSALEETNRALVEQIQQRSRAELDLKHLATHDPLTSVPNRVLLRERMDACLSRARRHDTHVALILLDLDHFKEVNDAYGHAAGDELLRLVAERLRACVRTSDVVARLGGDEFVLLLEDVVEPEEAAIVAERVLRACSAPFLLFGNEVHTPPSLGIAVFPNDCSNADDLLKCADLAMYEAKEAGRATFRFYAGAMLASSHEKLKLREELMRALERDQFCIYYQPLVELESGTVTGMEALVRWQHPELGLVPPIKFIPAAERSGLIAKIGAWVLRTACSQLAEWRRGGANLSIAVNVSAREVQAPDFVDIVTEALAASGLEPAHLELELTESVALKDPERSADVLGRLHRLGVRLAIDDFGSGYSSLMRLRQMPISVLKIDRFFVQDIVSSPRDAAIVAAVVAMAHSLGLKVVAEGVETRAQLDALRSLEADLDQKTTCDLIQGYLLSRPLPAGEATALLASATALRF
jgi:diguanylate cyclase (GGDEF)-like protein